MHTPWFLKNWKPRPNNHWQEQLPQVDGQLMGHVHPSFPDPVEDVPESIDMQCFYPQDWHALYEGDC
jgi:hypothetical protein